MWKALWFSWMYFRASYLILGIWIEEGILFWLKECLEVSAKCLFVLKNLFVFILLIIKITMIIILLIIVYYIIHPKNSTYYLTLTPTLLD
jgi:hypothetical protein